MKFTASPATANTLNIFHFAEIFNKLYNPYAAKISKKGIINMALCMFGVSSLVTAAGNGEIINNIKITNNSFLFDTQNSPITINNTSKYVTSPTWGTLYRTGRAVYPNKKLVPKYSLYSSENLLI